MFDLLSVLIPTNADALARLRDTDSVHTPQPASARKSRRRHRLSFVFMAVTYARIPYFPLSES